MIWTGELSFWRASRNTAANTAAVVATQSAIKATFRALSSGSFLISRGRQVRHRPQVVLAEAVRL